ALAFQKQWHCFFHRRRADHTRSAAFDQHRPFGLSDEIRCHTNGSQLVRSSSFRSHFLSVGPTGQPISVHRFAAFLNGALAGPPTPTLALGLMFWLRPSGLALRAPSLFRYTASRPS